MAIKFRTLGCIDVAKNNPVLTHEADVKNFSVVTKGGISYLVWNEFSGDESYLKDRVIAAGDYLNGYNLSANIGQELVITADMINEDIEDLDAGDAVTLKAAYLVGTPVVDFKFVEALAWNAATKAVAVSINAKA
jgi:hypothetical protein